MNREIKFRAWQHISQIMIPNENLEFGVKNLNKSGKHYNNSLVFMQYTGLKDKNGKEIYEGDIVRVYDEDIRKVEFKNAFWLLEEFISEGYLGGFGTPTESGHKPLYRYPNWNIEIIGNIYQNPELIKQ